MPVNHYHGCCDFQEFKIFKKEKKQYFKSITNWFEIITMALAIGGVTGYMYKLFVSMSLMQEVNETPEEFHSFQYLAYWDDVSRRYYAAIV